MDNVGRNYFLITCRGKRVKLNELHPEWSPIKGHILKRNLLLL